MLNQFRTWVIDHVFKGETFITAQTFKPLKKRVSSDVLLIICIITYHLKDESNPDCLLIFNRNIYRLILKEDFSR